MLFSHIRERSRTYHEAGVQCSLSSEVEAQSKRLAVIVAGSILCLLVGLETQVIRTDFHGDLHDRMACVSCRIVFREY
jgi:hypothetical protein